MMNGKNGSKIRSIEEKIFSYYEEISRYLRAFGIDPADFEDVLDEVFITALASADKIREPDKVKNYLLVVAKNTAKQYFLKRSAEMRRLVSLDETKDLCYCESEEDFVIKEIAGSLGDFRDIDLYNALMMLRPEERSILLLHYSYGYTLREISALRGMGYNNVRVTAMRARRKLKKSLEDMGYERQAK